MAAPDSLSRLADLAAELCRLGREIFEYRRFGNTPPRWASMRAAGLPPKILAAESELIAAEAEAAARRPPSRGAQWVARGSTERERRALAALEAVSGQLVEAENQLRTAWFEEQVAALRRNQFAFGALLEIHRLALAGLRSLQGRAIGPFRGESGAEVVLAFASSVLTILVDQYFDNVQLRAFDGFDPEDLAGAVRAEVADAMRVAAGAPKPVRNGTVAQKLMLALAQLAQEGRYDATQAQVAELAGCSERELRRGRGKELWLAFRDAVVRPREVAAEGEARSVQAKLKAERARQERKEEGRD